jgi:hypothetical protein
LYSCLKYSDYCIWLGRIFRTKPCNYSPTVLINFNVPSDAFPRQYSPYQDCIQLYSATPNEYGINEEFAHLDLLMAVNIPQTSEPEYVIGRSYIDSSWLVCDLTKDKLISKDASFSNVEKQWERLGNAKPEFTDTENYGKFFKNETERSRQGNADMDSFARSILIFAVGALLLVLGSVVGTIVGLNRFFNRKRSTSHRGA